MVLKAQKEPRMLGVIPMSLAVGVVGIGTVLDSIQTLRKEPLLETVSIGAALKIAYFHSLAVVPQVLAIFTFVFYILHNTDQSRRGMVLGCHLMSAANVVMFMGVLHALLTDGILPEYFWLFALKHSGLILYYAFISK